MPGFYIDSYYFTLVLPAVLIALFAQIMVSSTFKKYNKVRGARGLTGAMVARQILDDNGLQSVKLERVNGNLTDHFDPRSNVIRLSDSVYNSDSVGAVGVAAHEVGHAIQYSKDFFPMRFRAALIPITNIGSTIAIPLAILGIVINVQFLSMLGAALFGAVVVFQLVTLPVEFNASSRAIKTLEAKQMLSASELVGTKRVLFAAAMTYVAALLVSIANLLRILLLRNRNNR